MGGDTMDHAMSGLDTTNLHTHGLHVSPGMAGDSSFNSDNVLLKLEPGQSARYRFDIDEVRTHQPGTFWYHPHVHGSTAVQVVNGMAGALIIEGEVPECIAEAVNRWLFPRSVDGEEVAVTYPFVLEPG